MFGTHKRLPPLHLSRGIDISGTRIDFTESIKLLGVVLDASLTFEKHVLDVVRGCHFHIRALRHIKPLLTLDATKTFAVAIVSSRLDYCNTVCCRVHLLQIKTDCNRFRMYWRVHVVAQAPWSVSSTDLCRDFYWLLIRQRIVYKQCLMTYKAIHIGQPIISTS